MTTVSSSNLNTLPINAGDPLWRIVVIDGVPVWVDASGEVKGRAAASSKHSTQKQLLEAYLIRMRDRELEDEVEPETIRTPSKQYFIVLEILLNGAHRIDAVITTGDESAIEITGINNHAPDAIVLVSSVQVGTL